VAAEYTLVSDICITFWSCVGRRSRGKSSLTSRIFKSPNSDREIFSRVDRYLRNPETSSLAAVEQGRKRAVRIREMDC
jgi:hypothetical protein